MKTILILVARGARRAHGGCTGGGGGTGNRGGGVNTGTLSVSEERGNNINVSGAGFVGAGRAVVTLAPGSYTVWGTNPASGQRAWQTTIRIDAGKTSIIKR